MKNEASTEGSKRTSMLDNKDNEIQERTAAPQYTRMHALHCRWLYAVSNEFVQEHGKGGGGKRSIGL